MEEFKVMVTGIDDDIIWNIVNESVIESNQMIYQYLSKEININEWKKSYIKLYCSWLDVGDDSIYQITHPINKRMIDALININEGNAEFKIYYWFDVDRDKYSDYIWERCPLTNKKLITLSSEFHKNNKKISSDFPLIFPE